MLNCRLSWGAVWDAAGWRGAEALGAVLLKLLPGPVPRNTPRQQGTCRGITPADEPRWCAIPWYQGQMRHGEMGGLDRGPKKSLCQSKDWFFISLSFTWRTGFESCLCLLQIFFSERHWMCFRFGDAHLAILGILKPTLWYLLAQHTAEPNTESSLCTSPTSPFRAVCGHLGPAGGESPSSGRHPGDHNFPILSDCHTSPFAKQRLSSCLVCRAVRRQIQQ